MAKINEREKRGEAFYRELRDDFSRSGKTQRAFAEERGVPAGTVSSWFFKLRGLDAVRKQRQRSKSPPASPSARTRSARRGRVGSPFLPVQVVEAQGPVRGGSGYEVVLGRGVLRLPADFDPARVGALLRAVEVGC